ncbi:MFS transporter [Microbacterium sp. LMI1-1-1.1]|uniref:MFS transporter n=1 Tax=Microbacterium sp. LMI1-1-1.1 TaxID=3135223 RepID=UPI0034679B94
MTQQGSTTTAPARAGAREWIALIVLTLAVTLLAVDGTVLALAVPALTEALSATSTQVLWIGDVYSLALAGLLVTMGNMADRIGRKRLLLIGAIGFGLSSALAAFALNAEMLILARAVLGISGATIMPSTLAIIRSTFLDARQRTRAIAIWSAGATAGAALGPLVGGALLENFWWGSVFLINIPVMLLVVGLGIPLLTESRNEARAPIDLVSALLSFATIVPIVYAIKTVVKDGLTLTVAIAAIVGIAAGVVFVRRQRRLTHPLIDVRLFGNPAFSGAVVANAVAIFALSGLLFFFSQYLQLVRGYSPLVAGLAELPATIASMLAAVAVGWVLGRLGRGRAIGIGLLVTALAMVLLALAEGLPNYIWLALALALASGALSISSAVSVDTIVTVVPRSRAGAASSISETAYELGIALGIAVLGSVLNAVYRGSVHVPDHLVTDDRAALTDSLAAANQALAERLPEVFAAAQEAFTTAMQITSVVAAVIIAAAGILALILIPNTKMQDADSAR